MWWRLVSADAARSGAITRLAERNRPPLNRRSDGPFSVIEMEMGGTAPKSGHHPWGPESAAKPTLKLVCQLRVPGWYQVRRMSSRTLLVVESRSPSSWGRAREAIDGQLERLRLRGARNSTLDLSFGTGLSEARCFRCPQRLPGAWCRVVRRRLLHTASSSAGRRTIFGAQPLCV